MSDRAKIHIKQPTQSFCWLLEKGSPAQYYVKDGCVFSDNPWEAMRFKRKNWAERWRDDKLFEKEGVKATEHCFITP